MTMTNRYSNLALQGSIQLIGNTLGLSKDLDSLAAGTYTSIGTFMTTIPNEQEVGWGPYTTSLPSKAYSMAELSIPLPNTIVYAELIWGATRTVPGSNITVNNFGMLIGPDGSEHKINMDVINVPNQDMSQSGETASAYIFSSDVTNLIQSLGNGVYTFGSIPSTLSPTANKTQFAGWGLYVVYASPKSRVQAVNLYTGTNITNDGPYGVTVNYPGPPAEIDLLAMGFGGDVTLQDGFVDRNTAFLVTPTKYITGPNNLYNNFYQSQINYPNGNLNTFGPHGTENHIALSTVPVSGARQGTDISTVSLKNYLNRAVTGLAMDITGSVDNLVVVGSGYASNLAQPIVNIQKNADKTVVTVGDEIIYTSVITNSISDCNNAVFTDTLPIELQFITGSVVINGVSNASANPTIGINLGNILVNGIKTVSFRAKVVGINPTLSIPNTSVLNYGMTVNGSAFTASQESNIALVNYKLMSATKTVDKEYARLGESILYTVIIGNYGTEQFTNTIFYDTLPFGVDFVSGSMKLNGVSLSSENPSIGANLGILDINTINTVTFLGLVNTVPINNKIDNVAVTEFNVGTIPNFLRTNVVTTTITSANLKIQKMSDQINYGLSDQVTYTFIISNVGSVVATNIRFMDTIANETSFISGSFKENNIFNSQNPTVLPGANIGNVVSGGVTTISFKVSINSIPNRNPIENTARVYYNYVFGTTITESAIQDSNVVNFNINAVDLNGLSKSVDKVYAMPGDILRYKIIIPNKGTVVAKNVVFYDTIPNGTTFINGSVTVDGIVTGESPMSGIVLGNIGINEVRTVEFEVKIN
ncbi:MAG: hypothetical protein ACRC28_19125 [Clostridium sp.]|uniref:hypothetical protein n=1 Tax=Clostridium sp. TaxID=1506 RepID=UPI003F39D4DD